MRSDPANSLMEGRKFSDSSLGAFESVIDPRQPPSMTAKEKGTLPFTIQSCGKWDNAFMGVGFHEGPWIVRLTPARPIPPGWFVVSGTSTGFIAGDRYHASHRRDATGRVAVNLPRSSPTARTEQPWVCERCACLVRSGTLADRYAGPMHRNSAQRPPIGLEILPRKEPARLLLLKDRRFVQSFSGEGHGGTGDHA